MMPVTQMPGSGGSQPIALYLTGEGIPDGGSAGGGKRPGKPTKKTATKKGGTKAPKKGVKKR
jgi:hypothetical protein